MEVSDMTADRHEDKVLRAIVVLDAVSVVDLLPAPEITAKLALHDEAMLKAIDAASGDLNIPIGADPSDRLANKTAA